MLCLVHLYSITKGPNNYLHGSDIHQWLNTLYIFSYFPTPLVTLITNNYRGEMITQKYVLSKFGVQATEPAVTAAYSNSPDSKFHGANMGPTWVPSSPGGPHVGPMNLAIWEKWEANIQTDGLAKGCGIFFTNLLGIRDSCVTSSIHVHRPFF